MYEISQTNIKIHIPRTRFDISNALVPMIPALVCPNATKLLRSWPQGATRVAIWQHLYELVLESLPLKRSIYQTTSVENRYIMSRMGTTLPESERVLIITSRVNTLPESKRVLVITSYMSRQPESVGVQKQPQNSFSGLSPFSQLKPYRRH